MKPSSLCAFSLIELLIVVAIMGLLAVLTLPALQSTNTATRLANGAQTLADQWQLAAQMAHTRNQPIEARLYQLPGTESAAKTFRAYQLFFVTDSESYEPASKLFYLPGGIEMNPLPDYSPLLTELNPQPGTTPLPKVGTDYQYIAFQFHPDGSLSLSSQTTPVNGWFVTLEPQTGAVNPKTPGLKKNFVTITIDPNNSTVRLLRP